ncbi:MAG: hypothetical protein ACUVX8_17165 [Candidatus Zipacnadales bacterium]
MDAAAAIGVTEGLPTDELDASTRQVLDIQGCSPLGTLNGYVWGCVWNVDRAKYNVIVYIQVSGQWWPKPYFADPDTPIQSNGTWKCDIVTGGHDQDATRIFAGLAPKSYIQPLGPHTGRLLPRAIYDHCVSWMEWQRESGRQFRTLVFPGNGYEWEVKNGRNLGPGPNDFSWSNWLVWLDRDWNLFMVIAYREGGWKCSEIINHSYLGYGTYCWTLQKRVDNFDPNVVLGLFTWDDTGGPYNREIDIEFGRLDHPAKNAQYVLQPWDLAGQRSVWSMPSVAPSTHLFRWTASKVIFESHQGQSPNGPLLKRWTPTGQCAVPKPGKAQARTNLWLYHSKPPTTRPHVVITNFTHVP